MALLHYENLTPHQSAELMQSTVLGLQEFFKFLDNTRKYLESEKAVKRLGWEPAIRKEEDDREKEEEEGVWVQLIEPEGVNENFDANFKEFLDENNKEVYQASANNWASVGAAAQECPKCWSKKANRPKISYQTEEHANEELERTRANSVYKCPNGYGWHLTSEHKDNRFFGRTNKIIILRRDREKEQILLERRPDEALLVLRPNTHQIMCQIRAIKALQNTPTKIHRPLLRLFEASDHIGWPSVRKHKPLGSNAFVDEWFVLKNDQRDGTNEQREFVEIALNTPDFAFLEGPPGSGKTTAICELIIQLALKGKRILLCASTHVAVDNVLERLMGESNRHRDCILPIRIGDARVSQKAEPWQLKNFISTECDRLRNCLDNAGELSDAQKELQEQLSSGSETIQRMVLESANLVCGTTIGILQHPDIKERAQSPQFDLMIIDEASKTTFQEFLVPALLAKRWVLVGDAKQLSPYVDDESTAVNIEPCLPDKYKREACVDVFRASIPSPEKRIVSLICSDDQRTVDYYEKQASCKKILFETQKTNQEFLLVASLVVGGKNYLQKNEGNLPLDIEHVRNPEAVPLSVEMQIKAYLRLKNKGKKLDLGTWESEIAWRLARLYEQRLDENVEESKKRSVSEKLEEQVEHLLPHDDRDNKFSVWEQIERVRRVALPSVLESLQEGFEKNSRQQKGTALSDGLPEHALKQRCVVLTWQHRMHPDIAEFSHQHIYHKEALRTPEFMKKERDWSYRPDSKRCVWRDVRGEKNRSNANKEEVYQVISELKKFDEWAQKNPNIDSVTKRKKAWEVALLTFYRGQERELINALGKCFGFRCFSRGDKKSPYLDIQVCTVDRFQGHEADFVLLSFSNSYATSFLKSPNRLNVAITRARYQLVVFGNRKRMKKASGILGQFVDFVDWEKSVGVGKK